MNPSDFASLGLIDPVLQAVREEGYTSPTPIQAEAIPAIIAGRDLLGIAQTGTGKTAAFALPIIQRLHASPIKRPPRTTRVLVVAPTRELAAQIDESFSAYGRGANLIRACVFGGVGSVPQEKALSKGVDVLTATPGRLLDLIDRNHLSLSGVETVVLDEADRMFDMGFIRDVRRIVALLPKKRQTVLFSATMPPEIEAFADPIMTDPVRAAVPSAQPTADRVDQKVLFVSKEDKRSLLSAILKEDGFTKVIVFTKTKHGANRLVKQLETDGIVADAIHANKSQNQRTRAMDGFRAGSVAVLVATDLAARGIDVDDVELVVNYDLPNEPETYVHRIGRTARAGNEGVAVSFCDSDERVLLRDIERLVGFRIPVELDHPFRLEIEPLRDEERGAKRGPSRGPARPRTSFAGDGDSRPPRPIRSDGGPRRENRFGGDGRRGGASGSYGDRPRGGRNERFGSGRPSGGRDQQPSANFGSEPSLASLFAQNDVPRRPQGPLPRSSAPMPMPRPRPEGSIPHGTPHSLPHSSAPHGAPKNSGPSAGGDGQGGSSRRRHRSRNRHRGGGQGAPGGGPAQE